MRRKWRKGWQGREIRSAVMALVVLNGMWVGSAARAAGSTDAAKPGVQVGSVTGTDALLALVVVRNKATAFVAGGAQTLASLSGYFEGTVAGSSLQLEDSSSGRTLSGRLSPTGANGTLRLRDGRQLAWSASPADARKGAGFYLFADERALTGAIVTNSGKLQGVTRSLSTGRLGPATLSGALKLGESQRVSIPGSRRGQFVGLDLRRIRNPIEGLIRLWAFQPQNVQAATQSIIRATDSFGNLINPWDVAVIPSGSEDLADIILITDRNSHNLFAFDTCSDPPTIQVSATGVFDNIRDVDLGSQGIWVSNTDAVFNFELPDPIPTFQIPGFGIADDISFKPATGNFVVLDVLDTAPNGSRFDALFEIAPDGLSFEEIKNPLHGSDQNLGTGGRRYMSAIAYGDDYLVAWTGRFGSGIDRVTPGGTQTSFAPLSSVDGLRGKVVPTDMVLFGEVVVVAVTTGLPDGTALLSLTPDGDVSILITPVGEHRPNGLAVERHNADAHIIVADFHVPPPDAAHGGTDEPVGGNIVRVFLDSDAELAHNVRLVQCQAGF